MNEEIKNKNSNEKNSNSGNVSIVIAIILVALGLGLIGYMQSEKWLKQNAINVCLHAGLEKYNYPESNTSSEIPSMEMYESCMKKMGY